MLQSTMKPLHEKAGTLLLSTTPYQQALQYANDQKVMLPHFEKRYTEAKQLGAAGTYLRSDMPVLADQDVIELKYFIARDLKQVIPICNWTRLPARLMKPTQSNIYVDKVLLWIANNRPVETALKASSYNHMFLDGNFNILDGHHRWLSLMLMNPQFAPPVFVIQSEITRILDELRKFTRKKGRETNE